MKCWTDYPFVELGDIEHQKAPIRPVQLLSFDGNKYCKILVEGVVSEVKAGYLYSRPGRCGEVPNIKARHLAAMTSKPAPRSQHWRRGMRP